MFKVKSSEGAADGLCFVWERIPYKSAYIVARIVLSCATAWLPLLSGAMVNLITTPGFPFRLLCLYAVGMLCFEMFNYAINTWLGYFWNKQTLWATVKIRKTLWRRAQQLSAQRWDSMSPGAWGARLGRDMGVVFGFLQAFLNFSIATVISFCFASAVMLWKVPVLWFTLMGFIGVQVFTYWHWRDRFRHMAKQIRLLDYTSGEVNYNLISMTGIFKSFGVATFFFPVYDRIQDRVACRSLGETRLNIHYGTIMQIETWCIRIVVLGFCLWRYLYGRITLGEIVVCNMYVGQLIGIAMSITSFLPSLEQGREGAKALAEFLNWCEQDKQQPIQLTSGMTIQARHVSFKYENASMEVIKDLSMKILPRTYVCFVGRNGSGKSTLIKLLMGIYRPTHGDITTLLGCAFVPQHNTVFHDTFLENVRLRDPSISVEDVRTTLHQCGLVHFFDSHPLEQKLKPNTLSGGQVQLLAIARAMVRKPQVLLLDELTNNLDVVAREQIQAVLEHIRTQCTIISVTHDLRATHTADRVFIFQSANIIELYGDAETRERTALESLRKERMG